MDILEKNHLLIEFEYNAREIQGIEEFKGDLENNYLLVQGRPRFISAASEGGEFWLTVFINSPIGEFLAQNIAWDLFKYGIRKMFLKPLFSALSNLEKANANTYKLRIKKLKLQFDDTYLYIAASMGISYRSLGRYFKTWLIKSQDLRTKQADPSSVWSCLFTTTKELITHVTVNFNLIRITISLIHLII